MIKELTKNSWPLFIQNDVAAKNAYKYYADILTGKKYANNCLRTMNSANNQKGNFLEPDEPMISKTEESC